eukprot:c20573_g1_i1.p1 GENE.c20573_g1_i1~~c20573_g1_i1.p1  ORF type:complete len:829 (+),score=355.58 c20573_g1_i1:257-2488(+)
MYFGYDGFKPNQYEAVTALMEGRDVLVIMPTGGGKSMCYQLPALIMPGISIVISPLIALMQDQVEALVRRNINARAFHSSLTNQERQDILKTLSDMCNGVSQTTFSNSSNSSTSLSSSSGLINQKGLKLLYTTPETLTSDSFYKILVRLYHKNLINFIAVDEAHCISEWGHEFRKSYRRIGKLRESLPSVPVIAATATATKNVMRDISCQLKLQDQKSCVASFDRPEIFYSVVFKAQLKSVYAHLKHFLQERMKIKKEEKNGQMVTVSDGCAIIYCHKRESCTQLAEQLTADGILTKAYHGKLSASERSNILTDFIRENIMVVVATVAFGMGIDKHNVRCVVHMEISGNMEAFYQESGRAGRDGSASYSLVYYSPEDADLREFLARKTLATQMEGSLPKASEHSCPVESTYRLRQMCENFACRRKAILGYFGEEVQKAVGVVKSKVQVKSENQSQSLSQTTDQDKKKFPCCDVCDQPEAVLSQIHSLTKTNPSFSNNERKKFGHSFQSYLNGAWEGVEEIEESDDEEEEYRQRKKEEDDNNERGFREDSLSDYDFSDDFSEIKSQSQNSQEFGKGFQSARQLMTTEPTDSDKISVFVVDRSNFKRIPEVGGMLRSRYIAEMIDSLEEKIRKIVQQELEDVQMATISEKQNYILQTLATLEHSQCFLVSKTISEYKENMKTLSKKLVDKKTKSEIQSLMGIKNDNSQPNLVQKKLPTVQRTDVFAQFGITVSKNNNNNNCNTKK